MDPLALAAVVGLVFAGKRFAEREDEETPKTQRESNLPPTTRSITRKDVELMANPVEHSADYFDLKILSTRDLSKYIRHDRVLYKKELKKITIKFLHFRLFQTCASLGT